MDERSRPLLVFETTNIALKAERILKDAGVALAVIPTPTEISAGCGIALLLQPGGAGEAESILDGCEGVAYRTVELTGRGC